MIYRMIGAVIRYLANRTIDFIVEGTVTKHYQPVFGYITILITLVVVSGCTPNSTHSILPTTTIFVATIPVSDTHSPQATYISTETERPPQVPTHLPVETAKPTLMPSVEMVIDSGKQEIGTLFLGTDGSIVKHVNLPCNYSAVPGADYLYCLHPSKGESGMELDRVDFNGNILDHRTLSPGDNDPFAFCFNYSISPDGKWATFMHGDGNYDPRFSEHLNLYLLNLEQKGAKSILVTKNERSTIESVTWTSTGTAFAYADKDENGIVQIFEMNVNTLKTIQISHFDEAFRGQWIYQAKISPDNNNIAFTTIKNNGLGVAGVVTVADNMVTWMQYLSGGYEPLNNPVWWNHKGSQILMLIQGVSSSNSQDTQVIWYDAKTGMPTRSFPEKGKPSFPFEHMFPLKDIDVIGLWGYDSEINGKQYWLFDAPHKILKKIELPDLGLTPYQLIQLVK